MQKNGNNEEKTPVKCKTSNKNPAGSEPDCGQQKDDKLSLARNDSCTQLSFLTCATATHLFSLASQDAAVTLAK